MHGLFVSRYLLSWVIGQVDLLVEFIISCSFVGEVTSQHDEEHHSQGPYIRSLPSILLLLDDLRSHVAGCPAEDLHLHNPTLTFLFFSMQVLNPKSISLGHSLSSSIIFSNLISRWAMFFSWRYLSAPAISLKMRLQESSGNLWFVCCLMEFPSEMPGRYSMMIFT